MFQILHLEKLHIFILFLIENILEEYTTCLTYKVES